MSEHFIPDIRLASGLSRREFLRLSAASAGIAGLTALGPLDRLIPAAYGAPQQVKRLVVLNCFGGNDTLNMFVPVNLTPYYTRRVGLAIESNSALPLNTGPYGTTAYKLHPSMPKTAALWGEGRVAAVNRVGYPTANLSHFTSMDIFSYGVRGNFSSLGIPASGWIARFCDRYVPTPLGAVAVNVGRPRDIVGGTTSPLPVSTLAGFKVLGAGAGGGQYTPAHFHRLANAKKLIDNFAGSGRTLAQRDALQQAHDLTTQVQTALSTYVPGATYSSERLSQQMRDIAVLIQGGFESRIFYTGFGGFDTHSAQGTTAGLQATLFGQLDNALGSFADDLKSMNVWNDTVILVITEFGRRNYINGSDGTDHGHAFTALVLGGAVQGGVKGPHLTEADLNVEYASYAVDFRSIYKEILADHMGLDPTPVFPEALAIENSLGLL